MRKTILRGMLLAASTGLLAACGSTIDLDAPRGAHPGVPESAASMFAYSEFRCDADPAQMLVGRSFDRDSEASAIQLSGARHARTLRPGQVITMEYDPERVTLRLDEADRIVSVGCG
ncbi:MAG: I78 family peptidase inhibitor [Castellaniella sp.]